MHAPSIGMLAVPGASLYYESRGSGPALLIISTGNGDCAPFGPVADALADGFTVVTYDRRGFSRSVVDEPLADDARLATDADDARRLIEHLCLAPAHVFGTCSGAIVALALIERHPEQVLTLIAHEPPLASVLPDSARWLKVYDDLYQTYIESGVDAAKEVFKAMVGMTAETRPPKWAELPQPQLGEMLARLRLNQTFWFEHEIRTFPAFVPDLGALRAASDRLVLAGGSTSHEHIPYRASVALAEQIGAEVVDFPGGHLGHVTHPTEFVGMLAYLLGARSVGSPSDRPGR